jgi:hypothetical protein
MKLLIPAASAAIAVALTATVFTLVSDDPPPASARATPVRTVTGTDPSGRLTILDLRRTGSRVVTAKLRLDIEPDAGILGFLPELHGRGEEETAEGIRLYDDLTGRSIAPLRDPDGGCSCTRGLIRLHEGDKVELFARFPAPGPAVKTVTLSAPGFPPFYDLPLGTQD